MKGYPPGTKCVITWAIGDALVNGAYSIGDIVTVVGICVNDFYGPSQEIEEEGTNCEPGSCGCQLGKWKHAWPVAWLSPLEDPDEQTIEQEDEVTI